MFRKIHIENFRCFKRLDIEDLQNFNLIIGKNNSGKTALLEAIFAHSGAYNPEVALKLDAFRAVKSHEFNAEAIWSNLFYELDISRSIKMQSFDKLDRRMYSEITVETASNYNDQKIQKSKSPQGSTAFSGASERLKFYFVNTNGKKYSSYATLDDETIKFKRPDTRLFKKSMFISTRSPLEGSSEAQRFGKLQVEGKDASIVESLKILEPRLKKIISVPVGNSSMLFADIGFSRAIEINYLGEGIMRLLQIILAMAQAEKGIIMIDEIERGFHYSFYESTLKVIFDFAKQIKSQIFATTHSKEYLNAAYHYFNNLSKNDLSVIRLDKKKEEIKATSYDVKALNEVIEGNWEIR